MPREGSQSPSSDRPISPTREERRRSRSPRREGNRRRLNGGFKWKEKRRTDEGEQSRNRNGRLDRGYKDHYRARSPQRNRDQDDPDQQSNKDTELPSKEKKERKEKKQKKTTAIPAAGEAMIIVNVNDRLGTKAAIPCYASDPIKLFKAQVAAKIGREPHEILLKRQGERPFKDQLTLEDYGVSNGVQLDLEVDTGD
ncbi:hypothetical protein EPUS_04765 [Endocarpon pusillum Z07020]|uniref:Ubiquitin-like modifier HUB1 n=1 Tax=Endocarpon pusillum (strain Z07020 / HMAS-L-300199) TaxID=1263415 RepID=U1G5V3_ENDPU|nr:uncharacterized protein EPUS_04765 [Endocarpon pusillum Z07020]ERF72712.1 hypothetical protein EPUS_04765 [Endocarpon pusillum Z07020]